MKKLRKFLNVSVMVMTVLSMCGLGMISPDFTSVAKAAASAGDLIKMEGNSSVYYFDGAKRFVFPNENTYFSWYSDFSGVVTIPASELQSYQLGGNVTMRPGTKLVKITTDPSVYAVESNGVLRKIQNEAQAASLYGTDWANRVVDVADAFFTNYSIGSALASGEIPAGSLVKNAASSVVYYYDGDNYRTIGSEAAMTANRLSFSNVLTITNSITASGNPITGMEEELVKTSQGSTSGPVITGSGLMVSLNSMTPAAASVPQSASRVPFAKVNLTAANDGNVNISSITVKRSGLTTNSNGIKVWAEKDGSSISSKRSLSNDEAILTFSPALVIPAGKTVSMDILAELSKVTGNAALGIVSASAVNATAASVSGSFPVTGNTMSFTDYDVTELEFAGRTSSNYPVKVGDENVELGRFDLNFENESRDVVIKSVSLRNSGLEDLKDSVMNLYLENAGKKVSHNAVFDGRYAIFTMLDGGMEMLENDGNLGFIVKGDIIDRQNVTESFNSLELKLHKTEDLVAYEKITGFGVKVNLGEKTVSKIKIESGNVTVSKKSTSPTGEETTVQNTKNAVVLLANIKADEIISAEGLRVGYNGEDKADSSSIKSFSNVRVYLNNYLLESFDPESKTDKTDSSGLYNNVKLVDSAFTLNKGDNELKITVDVKSGAKPGHEFTVDLVTSDDKFLDLPEYVNNGNVVKDISGSASGATIKVGGAELEVVNNDGYKNDKSVVEGTTDVSLGKFAVKATNDDITITSVRLSGNNGSIASTSESYISGMKLFVDGKQIGNTRNFTAGGASFTGLNYKIAENRTETFELFGSFSSGAAGEGDNSKTNFKTKVEFSANDSSGKEIKSVGGSTRHSADTTNFKITTGGSLTVASAASTPNSDILIAKAGVEQEVAKFTLTSQNDVSNIKEIKIENAAGSNKTDRVASYKLYDGNNLITTATPFENSATFYITNDKLEVPNDGTKDITVKAVFNEITDVSQTGKELKLKATVVEARSSNGSEIDFVSGSNSDTANVMVVRKTKPTFTKLSGIVGGATSEQEMIRFSVTSDGEKLALNKLVFNFEGNASGTAAINGKTASLYEVGRSEVVGTATISSSDQTVTFTSGSNNFPIEIDGTKSFYVVANTSSMTKDARIGITMKNANTSVLWKEYFVTGYGDAPEANGQYIKDLPMLGGSMTY